MVVHQVNAFSTNYIWLLENDGYLTAIDCGQAEPLIDKIKALNLPLEAVLITHHHTDHVNGLPRLKKTYPDTPIYAPIGAVYGLDEGVIRLTDETLVLPQSGKVLYAMTTPGHTQFHLSFYDDETPALFCGDILFTGGCGFMYEGTPAQFSRSLKRINQLPDETLIYCGHELTEYNLEYAVQLEPENNFIAAHKIDVDKKRAKGLPTVPETLATERKSNPFLRLNVPNVLERATQYLGYPPSTEAEKVKAIRFDKDDFDNRE